MFFIFKMTGSTGSVTVGLETLRTRLGKGKGPRARVDFLQERSLEQKEIE